MSAKLVREEYIEQAYFFREFRVRAADEIPSQEFLATIGQEILATTKLPMAIEFLHGEILLTGRLCDGMLRLSHYFAPFQAFVMKQAEEDRSKFDQKTALLILEREAEYRAESPPSAGLFVYQFECIAKNRLGYQDGMKAMSADPMYSPAWQEWIARAARRLGDTDFANFIYQRSEFYVTEQRRKPGKGDFKLSVEALFSESEGRIAKANIGRDPLYMFSALQRQLDYPTVPKPIAKATAPAIPPAVENRLQRMELRIAMLEADEKSNFDLSKYYVKPPDSDS